jgi:DNA-binding MurR/RpiR family transcriptional regulator
MESVILSIKQARDSLTKTEQNIADYILKNPQQVVEDSVQELAVKIPTSPASIVRFSQKFCGTGGFSALKIKLSAESSFETDLYQELAPDDSVESLKKKLSFRIDQAITKTNKTLSADNINLASQFLLDNQTVIAFGIGASMISCLDIQQKFMRIGKKIFVNENLHMLTTLLLAEHQSTGLILVSNSGETQEVLKLAKIAKDNQLPVLSITQNKPSSLSKLSDIVLATDESTENLHMRRAATTSLISQLYVIDLLYYDYFSINYQTNAATISRSQKYIKKRFGKE